jgi:hypothetical protein
MIVADLSLRPLVSAADYDENMCRSTTAEVIARRLVRTSISSHFVYEPHSSPRYLPYVQVHTLSFEKQTSVMSTRYRYVESDGDISAPASALEVAIDQFAIQFLSSSEAENVVNALWRGQLVAEYGDNDNIEFVPFDKDGSASFWDHLNVHRLQVPRYQNVSASFSASLLF